jgi:hypothetical protein
VGVGFVFHILVGVRIFTALAAFQEQIFGSGTTGGSQFGVCLIGLKRVVIFDGVSVFCIDEKVDRGIIGRGVLGQRLAFTESLVRVVDVGALVSTELYRVHFLPRFVL